MTTRSHAARAVGLAMTLAALVGGAAGTAGCARRKPPPPPLQAPPVAVSMSHFAGTALSGPRPAAGGGGVTATPALLVRVEWQAMEQLPGDDAGLVPVGAAARLVLATRDREPVLSTSRLTATSRWATGDDAAALARALGGGAFGRAIVVSSQRAAVPRGVSVNVHMARAEAGPDDAPQVDLFLHHVPAAGPNAAPDAPGLLEVTLGIQDFAVPASAAAEPTMNAPAEPKKPPKRSRKQSAAPPPPPPADELVVDRSPALSRELVVMPPLQPGAPAEAVAVIVLPSAFPGPSKPAGLAATVWASPAPDDPQTQQLLVTALADVRRQRDAVAAGRGGPTTTPAEWPGYASALAMLDDPGPRRRAMVYLASQTGARLCEDVALAADDGSLQQLAADVRARAAEAQPPFSTESLGWLLDRTCLEWSAKRSGENRLPAEVTAVLSTYGGEAGRRAASLEEMLRGASSRASLEARLASENMIYLEDSSPSARVRAFDWLAARGRAPAGYDPLGTPRERREAIERALDTAASGGPIGTASAQQQQPPSPPSSSSSPPSTSPAQPRPPSKPLRQPPTTRSSVPRASR